MPRIPKKIPLKKNYVYPEGGMYELSQKLPSWMLDARRGYYPENTEITPIQGPMLPQAVEARRQAYMDALEDYREAMNEMAAEQAYNKRAQVWNEYADLPRRARQFYPNRDDIGRYLVDYEYIPDEREAWKTTRDLPTLDRWSRKNWGEDYPMQDLYEFEGPTDLPPEFIDEPPWRMR